MTNKVSVTTRYTDDLLQKTKIIAQKEHRSWNNLIEIAVEQFVSEWEKKNGKINLE